MRHREQWMGMCRCAAESLSGTQFIILCFDGIPITPMDNYESFEEKLSRWMSFEKFLVRVREDDPSVAEVFLVGHHIYNAGAKALADAMQRNSRVAVLCLHDCGIGDEGARALAHALRNNRAVTQVFMGRNKLGKEGAWALADAVCRNGFITRLDLRDNDEIGGDGIDALADALHGNRTLSRLCLRRTGMGDDGAKALARLLCHNRTITELDLRGNGITNEGARALAISVLTNGSKIRLKMDAGLEATADAVRKLLASDTGQQEMAEFAKEMFHSSSGIWMGLKDLNLVNKHHTPAKSEETNNEWWWGPPAISFGGLSVELEAHAKDEKRLGLLSEAVYAAGLRRVAEDAGSSGEDILPLLLVRVGGTLGAAGIFEIVRRVPGVVAGIRGRPSRVEMN